MSRIQQAFNSLNKAFVTGTLVVGDCRSCAVGTLCKEASEKTGVESGDWMALFVTSDPNQRQRCITNPEDAITFAIANSMTGRSPEEARRLIAATPYTEDELAKVENAFEVAANRFSDPNSLPAQFAALCDTMDVLAGFDGVDPQPYKDQLTQNPAIRAAEEIVL